MSESRILVIDSEGVRAERTVALLEFMDLNPRWVTDVGDIDTSRHRVNDWMALVVGTIEDPARAAPFFNWLAGTGMPPVLLAESDPLAFARHYGLHEANVWPLEQPMRHAQMEALLRRASLKRLDAEHHSGGGEDTGPTGTSPAVTELRQLIEQVAGFDTTVLVLGESGTGKEVVSRAIHLRSPRRDGPFVAINCGAIPPDLLESELFGHEKGAFTGALSARKGRFEMAEGGTLLLDEIGDMSLPMQVKLLRVLQERTFERVGSNRTQVADVRIIAATHKDLEKMIEAGTFREDLYYRLNVFPIEMAPLRERVEDIPLLMNELISRMEHEKRGSIRFNSAAIMSLCRHDWPGNIRELANLVERMAIMHPYGVIGVMELPKKFRHVDDDDEQYAVSLHDEMEERAAISAPMAVPEAHAMLPVEGLDLKEYLGNLEQGLIHQALEDAGGVVARAAERLRIRRTTLVEKMRKYGMNRRDDDNGELAAAED